MFPDLKEKPYSSRLTELGLYTLEERRNRADLIEVYKMLNGYQDFHLEASSRSGKVKEPEVIR